MFKWRKEQDVAFRAVALREFHENVAKHVKRCFPERFAELGADGVGEMTQRAIERAAVYRIVAERDVCGFVDLMLVFGVDFDQRCAWAREILEAPQPKHPLARMRRLRERALEEA